MASSGADTMDSLRKEIALLRNEIALLRNEIALLRKEIALLRAEKLQVTAKDQDNIIIQQILQQILAKEQQILAKEQQISAKEQQISAKEQQITDIQQSSPDAIFPARKKAKLAHCSVIGSTASSASENEVKKSTTSLKLHCHWLALELYNRFKMNIEEETEIVINIGGAFTDTVQSSSLSKFVSAYQKIAMSHESKGGDVQLERTLTAQIARELDRYLFTDNDEAGVYHQLAYYGNSERGDGMVVPHANGIVDFRKSIMVYDFKPTDLTEAKTESIAYISRMLKYHCKSDFPVFLALFPTCSDIIFAFVVNLPQIMGIAEICQVSVSNNLEMKKLFASLHAGVHYLVHHPVLYKNVSVIEPLQGVELDTCNSLCRTKLDSYRVFCRKEHVYKLFDTHSCVKPNVEVLRIVEYFEDLSLDILSNDGRFQCLKYKYINGGCDIQTCTSGMFLSIAETLKILHSKDFVHSDVRLSNMVFDSDENKGYLIDFDLTDKAGTVYPHNYNEIEERHKNARKNMKREFEHDIFSLCFIIESKLYRKIEAMKLDDVIRVLSEE